MQNWPFHCGILATSRILEDCPAVRRRSGEEQWRAGESKEESKEKTLLRRAGKSKEELLEKEILNCKSKDEFQRLNFKV